MALTIVLASKGANCLRYRATYDGTPGTGTTGGITTSGAASPDIKTDCVKPGVLEKLANAPRDGYDQFAAGNLSGNQAKALWESIWIAAAPGVDLLQTPTAKLNVTKAQVVNGDTDLVAYASIGGDLSPLIVVAVTGTNTNAGSWLIDVFVPGTIGP